MKIKTDDLLKRVSRLLKLIRYGSGETVITLHGGSGRPYLQVSADACCAVTAEPITWHGRKWYLSTWMTDSEIVSTAFMAFLAAEEHECRERFKYKGQRIFGPHMDVDALADLLSTGVLEESVRAEVAAE